MNKINKKLLSDEFETIKKNSRVSIFWITETQARAERIEHLEKIGAITRRRDDTRDSYPYCVFDTDVTRLLPETDPPIGSDGQNDERVVDGVEKIVNSATRCTLPDLARGLCSRRYSRS